MFLGYSNVCDGVYIRDLDNVNKPVRVTRDVLARSYTEVQHLVREPVGVTFDEFALLKDEPSQSMTIPDHGQSWETILLTKGWEGQRQANTNKSAYYMRFAEGECPHCRNDNTYTGCVKHELADCPQLSERVQEEVRRLRESGQRDPVICFGCKEIGHVRRECPNQNRRLATNRQSINTKPMAASDIAKMVQQIRTSKTTATVKQDTDRRSGWEASSKKKDEPITGQDQEGDVHTMMQPTDRRTTCPTISSREVRMSPADILETIKMPAVTIVAA